MNTAFLVSLGRPVAICLVAGLLRFLQDYQANGKAVAALVDGGIVAAEVAAGWLGVAGAATGVNTARSAALSSKTPVA